MNLGMLTLRALGIPVVTLVFVLTWLALRGAPEVATVDYGDRPAATARTPTAAERMMARRACWTLEQGTPPDMVGKYPGHVVVVEPGASRPTYSAELVGAALEQVAFDVPALGWSNAVDHGLIVKGFCR